MDPFAEMDDTTLEAAIAERRTELASLIEAAGETPTDEQVERAETLAAEIEAAEAVQTERVEAAASKADRFAAVKSRFSSAPDEPDEPEDEPDEPDEPEAVKPEPAAEPEPVKAAAKGVKELAAKSKRPVTPERGQSPVVITAAANVDGFSTGETLGDTLDIAKAVIAKAKGFSPPTGNGEGINLQKFGTAKLALDFPEDLIIDPHTGDAQIADIFDRAADESRLPDGALTAAGWCAPSETVYDLTQDATTEGMLSLPEVGIRRGGIRFAMSPSFADFYANPGFIQTEAQAIANTVKPCVTVDCPSFEEVRLDAEGLCIKVPILTNVGYPEYVRTFVDGTLVAHQHWINANVIGRLVTAAGAARVITGLGATVTDTLEGLELLADQTRQKYRLSMNRTLEVVVPFWVRGAMRADLSRRQGLDIAATDAEIASRFRARKMNVQFVYDWQPLDETAEVYPATFNALMYPAGTFVKGTADVINLSTVYDAASLATNVYTGLFTEQGLLVAQRKFHADLLTLPICNAGRVGANDLTCVVTP